MVVNHGTETQYIGFYQEVFTSKPQHVSKCWLTMFEEKALTTPHVAAIINPERISLTYNEVAKRSTKMVGYFQQFIKRQSIETSANQVIAIALARRNLNIAPLFVAVLKMGAAVYFIEPLLGDSVNKFRLEQIKPDFLVVDEDNRKFANAMGIPHLILEEHLDEIDKIDLEVKLNWRTDQRALVVCSSGTTGQPKIMNLALSCFSNVAQTFHDGLYIGQGTRVLQLSRRNFDAVTLETVFALGNGGSLVLMDYETSMHPKDFEMFLKEFGIKSIFITPSHISCLVRKSTSFAALDSFVVGGEAYNSNLVQKIASTGVKRIFNIYGPTECGMVIMFKKLYDAEESIKDILEPALGKPFLGTNIRVFQQNEVTSAWELCLPGQQGELFVDNGLNNVYADHVHNESKYLTIYDPISGQERCYFRSGDIVNITEDEQIVFWGRRDNQIKISGQLVVTDEVVNHFEQIAGSLFPELNVQVYIKVERDSKGKPKSLRAYHTAKSQENAEMIAKTSSAALAKILPQYMLPKDYFWVPEFKIKVGGKLDSQYILENGQKCILKQKGVAPMLDAVI